MIGEEKVTMEEDLDTDQEVIDTEEIDFDTKVKESKISQVKHFCRRNWKKAVAVGGVLASVAIGYALGGGSKSDDTEFDNALIPDGSDDSVVDSSAEEIE